MNEQMKFADPTDWGTIAWAAERIGVSQRSVRRFVATGQLNAKRPRIGALETGRRHVLLYVFEVEVFADAYKLVGTRA